MHKNNHYQFLRGFFGAGVAFFFVLVLRLSSNLFKPPTSRQVAWLTNKPVFVDSLHFLTGFTFSSSIQNHYERYGTIQSPDLQRFLPVPFPVQQLSVQAW